MDSRKILGFGFWFGYRNSSVSCLSYCQQLLEPFTLATSLQYVLLIVCLLLIIWGNCSSLLYLCWFLTQCVALYLLSIAIHSLLCDSNICHSICALWTSTIFLAHRHCTVQATGRIQQHVCEQSKSTYLFTIFTGEIFVGLNLRCS